MGKTEDHKEISREVGEHVTVMARFEPETVKDLGEGVFEATVTTASTDRTMESIDTSGITTDSWVQTGMPVLYGHDYSSLPIGKGLSFKQFKTKMTARFQLATKEYPFAKTVADMIKGGYLNAVSIGGIVRQWNEDYTVIKAMDMVEFSVVPIPANAEAVITSRSLEAVAGKSVAEISREYQDFVQKETAKHLEKSLDMDELDRHIKSLKDLTVILEQAKIAKTDEKAISESDEVITLTIRKAAGKVSETGQQIIRLVKAKKED